MTHFVEYSKSGRAKCHGKPCNGSLIESAALRYGTEVHSKFGPIVQWWHWGCVTPYILNQMKRAGPYNVQGYSRLNALDKDKVTKAIKDGYVDPTEVTGAPNMPASTPTPSAMPSTSAALMPPPSQGVKRKASSIAPSASQASQTPSRTIMPVSMIDLTQEDDFDDGVELIDDDENELYCETLVEVVGLQYYQGLVGTGEEVILVREPQNAYDRNAIQVLNIAHIQVGHLARKYSGHLSPLIDQHLINIEGVMQESNMSRRKLYTLKMTLKIYGAGSRRDEMEQKLLWATPGRRGFPPRPMALPPPSQSMAGPSGSQAQRGMPAMSSQNMPPYPTSISASQSLAGLSSSQAQASGMTQAQLQQRQAQILAQQEAKRKAYELSQQLAQLQKVNDKSRRSSLLDTLCSTDDVLNLPEHPNPPGINDGQLKVNLLKHQSQALQWFLDREYPCIPQVEDDKPVQFWQYRTVNGRPYYYNVATKTPQEAIPSLGKGALCADSMGLGKTLSMLALILATKNDIPAEFCRSTLVVVPLSVMSNWETQIKDHCAAGVLSYLLYYGGGRSATPEQLQRFDVVVTTYQVVTSEYVGGMPATVDGFDVPAPSQKKRRAEGGLFTVPWKRVILDEGHNIRNPKTKMAQACCGLRAERRWVVTGTPIINSPSDLGSMLTFLQICRPLDDPNFFKRLLLRPLKNGDASGAELLRALMNQICLRRTKEMHDSEGRHLVPLPPVEMTVVPVQLNDRERELYDAVEAISKQRFEHYMNAHGGASIPTNVLSMLTRLRQLSLHPGLVPANYLDDLRNGGEDHEDERPAIQITPQERLRLQGILAQMIEDNEECPICFSIFNDPRITSCSHVYCLPCITEVLSRDRRCPMDRRLIGMGDLIEPLPPIEATQAPMINNEEESTDDLCTGSSSKIDQLVYLLKLTPNGEKSLVFSQFKKFLDKIAEKLQEERIPFLRFDGQMSARQRQEVIERFSVPIKETDAPTEMLETAQTQRSTRRQSAASSVTAAEIDEDDAQTYPSSSSKTVTDDENDPLFAVDSNPKDSSDFKDDGPDYDSFVDDNDNDSLWVSKKKSKSKSKAKGKGKATTKPKKSAKATNDWPISDASGQNPKVLLISLKAGALGLNLTVANNVYLMDPWWQEGIESQAIDRCNRIGQKKPVHVYQLIAENTVESKVLDIQDKKKTLIKQAFSGIKSKETQRQKREARLQELVELFGVQQRGGIQQTTLDVGTGSA